MAPVHPRRERIRTGLPPREGNARVTSWKDGRRRARAAWRGQFLRRAPSFPLRFTSLSPPLCLSLSFFLPPDPRERTPVATQGSRRPCLARITRRGLASSGNNEGHWRTRDHRTTRPPRSAEGLSSDYVRPRPAISVSAGTGARARLRATENGMAAGVGRSGVGLV